MDTDQPPRSKKKPKQNGTKAQLRWALQTFVTTLAVSMALSYGSSLALSRVGYIVSFLILAFIMSVGITFDIIGVAVTAADEKPFHAMASRRVSGAKEAISLIKNAGHVGSVCNDVIGDICGIISGSTAAAVSALMVSDLGLPVVAASILVTGLVSALTVGGKALCKTVALGYSTEIVHLAGRSIHFFKRLRPGWSKK